MGWNNWILPTILGSTLLVAPFAEILKDPLHLEKPPHVELKGIYRPFSATGNLTATGSGSVTITPGTGTLTLEGYQGEARVSE